MYTIIYIYNIYSRDVCVKLELRPDSQHSIKTRPVTINQEGSADICQDFSFKDIHHNRLQVRKLTILRDFHKKQGSFFAKLTVFRESRELNFSILNKYKFKSLKPTNSFLRNAFTFLLSDSQSTLQSYH